MVLECSFLRMVKGASHVPDECWLRVLFFLSDRDVASVLATCSRLHRLAGLHRKDPAATATKHKEASAAVDITVAAAAPVSAPVSTKPEPVVEEPKTGLFSLRNKSPKNTGSGTFSLRKPKKK